MDLMTLHIFIQKIKRSIFTLLVLAQLVAPITAIAGSDRRDTRPFAKDEMLAASGNLLIDLLNRHGDKINMKWVSSSSYKFRYCTHHSKAG